MDTSTQKKDDVSELNESVLKDYYDVVFSRAVSLMGRKEVFRGRAKFGIFGDGKELPQIAMAKVFKKGDFRSGYYRDQTFMFASEMLNAEHFFAQLFAHTDIEYDPCTAGRCMNSHFSTQSLTEDGRWHDLTQQKNSSSDISPTAGQIPRLIGLGYASKLFRNNPDLHDLTQFSHQGNEIAFGTIGNGSCAEGVFWEGVNAMGVLQIPIILSIWDDGYGISVHNDNQITKSDISELLKGFETANGKTGIKVYTVEGYDYERLCTIYREAEQLCRANYVPIIIHVKDLTQPLGHSSSGSHERYKPLERLEWEKENDCIKHFERWILKKKIADSDHLQKIRADAEKKAKTARDKAWKVYKDTIEQDKKKILDLLNKLITAQEVPIISKLIDEVKKVKSAWRSPVIRLVYRALVHLKGVPEGVCQQLGNWLKEQNKVAEERYSSHLYCENKFSALEVSSIPPEYKGDNPTLSGYEILNRFFDKALEKHKTLFAIGEDLGCLGGVNQGFVGLQKKYGDLRISDTGIREVTIVGQGVGAALRGLRPIVEIQYLDYIFYALFTLTDDVAPLRYRTKGRQVLPLIIRTRGHRYEGVWHSGSPMASLIHSLRGIYILVPRNMVQAVGFYNTMLQSQDPALIVECLNAYRQKEKLPDNIGTYTVPLGVPEILRHGQDITIVTYGALCKIVLEVADFMETMGIDCEVIDVQSLLPFDINHTIVKSLQKTSRLIIVDEDTPGGTSAYILNHILNEQDGYRWLDAQPITISSRQHRPGYGSDGDYFSKPNAEDIIQKIYEMMNEAKPDMYVVPY